MFLIILIASEVCCYYCKAAWSPSKMDINFLKYRLCKRLQLLDLSLENQ